MRISKFFMPAVLLSMMGCANIVPVSQHSNAQKTAGAICSSTGAALQAMVIAGAQGALQRVKPEAKVLLPLCNQATPDGAVTAAEAKAELAIVTAAAPYMGD